MGQVRHGCATTTHAMRAAIQRSEASIAALSQLYRINPKTVLKWRKRSSVEDCRTGSRDPGSTVPNDPMQAIADGVFDPVRTRLLPWRPDPSVSVIQRADAAGTAGLYHEALERWILLERRISGLRGVVERALRRNGAAKREVGADRDRFRDPEVHRVWGEALLAGLDAARRVGSTAFVRDPYSGEGEEIAVPADPAISLQRAASDHFALSRRARRGIERAEKRLRDLERRRSRLESLSAGVHELHGVRGIEELEKRMLDEGIAVGLEGNRVARATARLSRPRIEGVRVYAATDGSTIFVGRNARDNHRLTFRLCRPEDFWLHAQGANGAHVILRNPDRLEEPSATALRQAAEVAAWYSELRNEDWVSVQWTRRWNVKKPRGAPPGTVTIKRFSTVRVRPHLPTGGG